MMSYKIVPGCRYAWMHDGVNLFALRFTLTEKSCNHRLHQASFVIINIVAQKTAQFLLHFRMGAHDVFRSVVGIKDGCTSFLQILTNVTFSRTDAAGNANGE